MGDGVRDAGTGLKIDVHFIVRGNARFYRDNNKLGIETFIGQSGALPCSEDYAGLFLLYI